jgi:hypothetical protein
VFIYFNLHKKKWSIRHKGIVIGHADSILLKSAKFKVSKKGRERVLKTGVKNVHAGVVGTLIGLNVDQPNDLNTKVSYNPFKNDQFYKVETNELINDDVYQNVFLINKCVFI